jgi:predicted nucleotide-binding protein
MFGSLGGARNNPIIAKKEAIKYKLESLNKLVEKADLLKSSVTPQIKSAISSNTSSDLDTTSIFIVHGHDATAENKVARFIEKLGFNPIILHEQASGGNTIMEKIELYANVGFGIVLYTPCDKGCKNGEEHNLQNRARQNVVFEHGYLIGRIGRSKVCALVKGDIEKPNDISGVVYVIMDEADGWHFTIAKELKKAGYEVDLNKL